MLSGFCLCQGLNQGRNWKLWVLMYIQRQEKLVMSGSSPTFNIKDYSLIPFLSLLKVEKIPGHGTTTVIAKTTEGARQGGVEFRQTGLPVAVKVAVPLVNAKYPSCTPAITAGLLIEIVDQT